MEDEEEDELLAVRELELLDVLRVLAATAGLAAAVSSSLQPDRDARAQPMTDILIKRPKYASSNIINNLRAVQNMWLVSYSPCHFRKMSAMPYMGNTSWSQ
jgi:hypothetical protein